MNFNPLIFKLSYANLRGRAQNSIYNGIYAPDSFGGFLLPDFKFGGAENTTGFCRIISRDYRHVLSPRSLAGLGNLSKKVYNMKELSIYNFNSHEVRTTTINGEPWFCLADCALALGIKNAATSVKLSAPGVGKTYIGVETGKKTDGTPAIQQVEITIINEPNLYRLIFRSNKPQAQAFADWVYNEVLPAIRKTGGYGVPALSDKETLKTIGGMVKSCAAAAMRTEFEKIATDMVYGEKFKQLIQSSFSELFSSPKDKGLQNWCSSTIAQIIEAQAALMAEEKFNEYAKDAKKALDKYSTKSATQLFIEQEVKKLYGRN